MTLRRADGTTRNTAIASAPPASINVQRRFIGVAVFRFGVISSLP
jgi:hypothetical protein